MVRGIMGSLGIGDVLSNVDGRMRVGTMRLMAGVVFLVSGITTSGISSGDEASSDDVPQEIAGRTLEDFAVELQHEDRTTRLQAIRSLAPFGLAAAEHFVTCLTHEDAAMRYLAAVGLGDLGKETADSSASRLKSIASDDSSQAVRMASAYALCQAGQLDEYLPKLAEFVGYPERGMACCAALLIGKLGPAAKAATPALQTAYEANTPGGSGDYHIGGAAKNALRKLGVIE